MRENLTEVLQEIVQAAETRELPSFESARQRHRGLLRGLRVPDRRFVGAFRGEVGLESIGVRVGDAYGVSPSGVAGELERFQQTLRMLVAELDALVPKGHPPNADQLSAILDLCAWAHAEWIRLHPFANGNGRTARLWANSIAVRYGLPPFIGLRPRPNHGYGQAGAKAMQGDWKPTAAVFRKLFDSVIEGL